MMQEADFVVVGGGTAGCVLAGRLSEDPKLSVCLLEAGKPDDSWRIQVPLGFAFTVPTRQFNWAFETVPQAGLNGRRGDRKSTRLNSSHNSESRMPSSA
jgi:choline dehydrogenase-like flavoprotein